jgi:uncharacterized protein
MLKTSRRDILRVGLTAIALPGATVWNFGCTPGQNNGERNTGDKNAERESAMKIQYLEIVTPDVAAACALYSQMHGVTFGDAVQKLGGARTANLANGGMLGIRAPLRDTEKPVVRPYLLVKDIKASVAAAAKAGAQIAMAPTEIAGQGQFAIVIHGGIESGLWQL